MAKTRFYHSLSAGLEYADRISCWRVKHCQKKKGSLTVSDGTIYQPLRSGRIWHKVNF